MDKAIVRTLEHIKEAAGKLDTKGEFHVNFARTFPLGWNYSKENGLQLEVPAKTWEVEELIIATMNGIVKLRQEQDNTFSYNRIDDNGDLEECNAKCNAFTRNPTTGSVDLSGDGAVSHEKVIIKCVGSRFNIDIPHTNLRIVDVSFSSSTGNICWIWVSHRDYKGRNNTSAPSAKEQKDMDDILDGNVDA